MIPRGPGLDVEMRRGAEEEWTWPTHFGFEHEEEEPGVDEEALGLPPRSRSGEVESKP